MKRKRICIITPGYISSSPRTVKEADSLVKAGFDVRVVFSEGDLNQLIGYDRQLLKQKLWNYNVVKWSSLEKKEKFLYYTTKLRHFLIRVLPRWAYSFGKFAEYGEGRVYKELATLAAKEQADLYIGHYPTGLAAAAYAADKWNAKLAYDSEDLHTGELPEDLKQTQRIKLIEKKYLSDCSYVTASSEFISKELMKRYKIEKPLVIHNVFPLAARRYLDNQKKDKIGEGISFYWYSQVIGLDRGIQDLIKAAGFLKSKFQIHLRGYLSEQVRDRLIKLAKSIRVADKLYFHSVVSTQELLSRTAEHDIGFALEQPVNLNREISVTNKIFFYMLAGLAVVASDTSGQKEIIKSSPRIGFLYQPGDYKTLAAKLNQLIADPNKLKICKKASLKAAEEKWNWKRESRKLIAKISEVLIN